MKLLFICTGNTCRSPMAAGFFNKLAQENNHIAEASSCGIHAFPGMAATENAVLAAAAKDVDISSHKARQVTADICANADMIFCMAERHKTFLVENGLAKPEKIFVLTPPVQDPFGQSLAVYNQTANRLYAEALAILQKILQGEPG